MTREANDTKEMTPFSRWVRAHCRDSKGGLSLTNLDFEVEDFRIRNRRRLMLLEEKRFFSKLQFAQAQHFRRLDIAERLFSATTGSDYWGFFLIQFSQTYPGDSDRIAINGKGVTKEELRDHINGDAMAVVGLHGARDEDWRPFLDTRR